MLLEDRLYTDGFNGGYFIIAVENDFVKHAPACLLRKQLGLDSQSLEKRIRQITDN